MPLYEYVCEQCEYRFELIRKFSDPPLEVCPKCGGKVRKLMSSPAIQFKGTGWYITDYAKKDQVAAGRGGEQKRESKSGDAKGGDASADSKAETKSETKSETKTEAKTDTKTDSKT